jgi:hypothetical protein
MVPQQRLPKIGRLKVGRDSIDIDYYLTADYVNIKDAADELPAVIEWINSVNQGYVEQMHSLKDEVKQAEAIVYFELLTRDNEESFNVLYPQAPKPTADALAHAIELDPRVREVKSNLANKRAWVERLRGLQSSLTLKIDLTRSSEATNRKVFSDRRDPEDE